ncbi:MAG TPA: MazG nucleotide pyrophosphohydrolase domain-containing protein, partial [Syntrophales bacterium]|nr:MazG nucleotide pyrophosphohydrolase domain-containing protein [Syntrophales bacterium]
AVGFDWKDAVDVLPKVREELEELESAVAAGSPGDVREELGDLLFALVNLSRFLSVDGEEALQAATDKFIGRFLKIEGAVNARGGTLSAASLEEMDALWNRFKTEERKS